MVSHYVQDEIRAAVHEEVSQMLGSPSTSGTGREISVVASRSTSLVNSDSPDHSSSSECTLSFKEFYRKHEEELRHGFKPPKKKIKKPVPPFHGHYFTEIGKCRNKGWFGSPNRRSNKASLWTQIIALNSLANKEEIMQKAVAKHASFDQTFDETLAYALLYPDFREVIHVPGTNDKFSLAAYKQAIGKEFKRLTFYLIPLKEFYTSKSDESDSKTFEGTAKLFSTAQLSLPYSFLRDLQGVDLATYGPSTLQPIIPYLESLQRSEASPSMVREQPNFIKIVWDMRQNLFRCTRGRVMGREDPPEERALVQEWTENTKVRYLKLT